MSTTKSGTAGGAAGAGSGKQLSLSKKAPPAAGAGTDPDPVMQQPETKSACKQEMTSVFDAIKTKFTTFIERFNGENKKETDKSINANIKVYANKDKNSKGYSIYGYKVDVENQEYPFSNADEVNYFLENLIKKTENDTLKPDNKDKIVKQGPDSFFTSYKVSIPLFPLKTENIKNNKQTREGGKKKTIKRNRKKHNKSKRNKQEINKK
tara:strand:- start:1531 stop:2157 length:627 start_codon:yes stop_codon:yes gene_type:complete